MNIRSAVRASQEAVDVVVSFLPRLGFILAARRFRGQPGGDRFSGQVLRVSASVLTSGMSIHDLRQAIDFFDLPANENTVWPRQPTWSGTRLKPWSVQPAHSTGSTASHVPL